MENSADEGPSRDGRSSSGLPKALIIFSIIFPLALSGAKLGQGVIEAHWQHDLAKQKFNHEKRLNNQTFKLEAKKTQQKNALEVNRLFLEQYAGASPRKQKKTINILLTLYPAKFVKVAKLFHQTAASKNVSQTVESASMIAEATTGVAKSVSELEAQGFESLLSGDLSRARGYFGAAYKTFPTYHNVDEIFHLVLTAKAVSKYQRLSGAKKKIALSNSIDTILTKYSWGVSKSMQKKLERTRH